MNKHVNWRPYVAGALLGVMATLSVLASTKVLGKPQYLGTSTTFVRAAGLIERTFAPDHVKDNAYYIKEQVKVDWQFMLVAGIFVGALVASLIDRSFKIEAVPPIWQERFGNRAAVRALGGFIGGVIAMFGARTADGCPSGNGLSGLMQLSISGFISLAFFFGVGVLVARLAYVRKAGA